MRKLLLAVLVLLSSPHLAFSDSSFADRISLQYRGKIRTLRPTIGSAPVFYGDGDPFGPKYKYSVFPVKAPTRVEIREVRFGKSSVLLGFRQKDKKAGTLELSWDSGRLPAPTPDELTVLLETAFLPEAGEDSFRPFVLNNKSRMIHFAGSNHLPPKGDRESLREIPDIGILKGVSKCPICFSQYQEMPASHYFEYRLTEGIVAQLSSQYPRLQDKELLARVQAVGTRILTQWPRPLVGYSYEFSILDTDEINACSAGTGKIFIYHGLLKAIETDAELEAVLAHEIAHSEQHHSLNEFIRTLQIANLMQFVSNITVLGAGLITNDSGLTREIATSMGVLGATVSKIAQSGYSIECETEADFIANHYLERTGGKEKRLGMISLLAKLGYAENSNPFFRASGALRTHPPAESRIFRAQAAKFITSKKARYVLRSDSKELLAEFDINEQVLVPRSDLESDSNMLIGTVKLTSSYFEAHAVNRPTAITRLLLNPSSGALKYDCTVLAGGVSLLFEGISSIVFECKNNPGVFDDFRPEIKLAGYGEDRLILAREEPLGAE